MNIKAGSLLTLDYGLGELQELCKESKNNKFNYRVARLISKLQGEIMTFRKQRDDAVLKYAKKDDKGSPVIEDGKFTFATPEDNQRATEEVMQIEECEIDVDIQKLRIDLDDDTIPPIGPEIFRALEPIIEVIDGDNQPLKVMGKDD